MEAINPALLAQLPKDYLEEDIGNRLIIVASVFIVLQTLAVTLYYLSRHLNKTLNGIECWLLMPIGYVFTMAVCVCGILIVKLGGAGRHVEAVLLQDPTGNIVMTRSKIDKSVELLDYAAISGSKLVILSLYLRIFSTDRRYQIATYFVGLIIVLNWLAAFILSFSICKPFAYQWDRTIPGGKCGNLIATYQFIGIPNIATDLMMLVLPLPALYKLHVDMAAKIGLFATFLTGSVGIVTSILRQITFFHASELFRDPTYKCVPTFTYTIAEAGIYLIASCMPTLRPLKRHIFGGYSFTSSVRSLLNKRSGSTQDSFGFRVKSSKKDVQSRSNHRQESQMPIPRTSSSLHLNNAGFLELDDWSASGKSISVVNEKV